jgi:hypothetical protein
VARYRRIVRPGKSGRGERVEQREATERTARRMRSGGGGWPAAECFPPQPQCNGGVESLQPPGGGCVGGELELICSSDVVTLRREKNSGSES